MLNTFEFTLPADIEGAYKVCLQKLSDENVLTRMWAKDASVWTDSGEENWLGWMEIANREIEEPEKYVPFAAQADGYSHIVLLGMGGSSLCPEVLAETFQKTRFHILDSTDPAQINSLLEKIEIGKTLFIVASKSGSTLEPKVFMQYFFSRVSAEIGADAAGMHFVAITDPGSNLQFDAQNVGFATTFLGEAQIGGRFSALSVFGMAPGAAMGLDTEDFLSRSIEMVSECRSLDAAKNPGAHLGALLGVSNKLGRDKLTIFTSPEIAGLGAWLEQLIAESTGKKGVAIIPIDGEEILSPDDYSDDRMIVYLRLDETADTSLDEKIYALEGKIPLVRIGISDRSNLGQEFYRWEFATAVAGAVMEINPFDQPDVEAAKIETRKLTDAYEMTGSLPDEKPIFEQDGIKLFTNDNYAETLGKLVGDEPTLAKFLASHIEQIHENDYFAILAFIERSSETQKLVTRLRSSVLNNKFCATCVGFGPRFLHSTGQAYKGGGNNGVFLQITTENPVDIAIPGQKYTFGVVESAQARGDFQVLLDRGRRALRIHLTKDTQGDLEKIAGIFEQINE